ncbi:MAG: heparinase II/III family protein [Verrucomicrobiota bacterium]
MKGDLLDMFKNFYLKSAFFLFMGGLFFWKEIFAEEEGFPQIFQQEVQGRVLKEEGKWLKSLRKERPRLFFTPEEWKDLPHRYILAQGKEKEYFELVLQKAMEVSIQSVPLYQSPQEISESKKITLFSANEELWQRQVGDKIVLLSFALALKENPKIKEKLRETVLMACQYPHWGAGVMSNMDLAYGHVSRGIAIAYDWHPNLWSDSEKELIRGTVRARTEIAKMGIYGNNGKCFWARKYTDNHNHVTCSGIGLCGVAFMGDIPEASEWAAAALTNFEYVMKYCRADGSSPEGVPYGGYALSYILQFIEGSKGVLGSQSLYESPFLKNAISFRLHASGPGFYDVLPWGDSINKDYCGPHHYLYRLASEYGDKEGQYLGENLPFVPKGFDEMVMLAMWYNPKLQSAPPQWMDAHAPVADILMSRSGWGEGDYFFSLTSGYVNRNHGHLDAGAIAFSFGDEWLIKAPGYGSGGGSPDFWKSGGARWTFFSNATESHSTLLINGKNQRFSSDARGTTQEYFSAGDWCWANVDLTGVYQDINSVRRSVLHRRGDYILVLDQVNALDPVQVDWLAQIPVDGKVKEGSLTMESDAGTLEVRSISSKSQSFEEYHPVSSHIDVDPKKLKSYTLKNNGKKVDYAVVLIPKFQGTIEDSLVQSRSHLISSGKLFEISSDKWRDWILSENPGSKQILTSQGIAASKGNFSFVGSDAKMIAARFIKDQLDSFIAEGLYGFEIPGIQAVFGSAVSISLRRVSEESWILKLNEATSLKKFASTNGYLFGNSKEGLQKFKEGTELSGGEYLITRSEIKLDEFKRLLEPKWISRPKDAVALSKPFVLPAASASEKIFVEAESYSFTHGEPVQIVEKVGASSGNGVKGFGSRVSQKIGWKFNVTHAGEYLVKLNYCTESPKVKVTLTMDGAAPCPGALDIPLAATGGWSTEENNWKNVVLTGVDGTLIKVSLTAGEHEIRLLKPTASVNLDSLEIQGSGLPIEHP